MENDTQTEIRSDLWHTMSVTELDDQLSLIYDKINMLHSLSSGLGAIPSHITMIHALEHAKEAVLSLINSKR